MNLKTRLAKLEQEAEADLERRRARLIEQIRLIELGVVELSDEQIAGVRAILHRLEEEKESKK